MAWAPDYVTEDELAGYLRIDDTDDNVELALAISGASRAIDGPDGANRQFGKVDAPEERTYKARFDYDRGVWVVDVDDYQTATGLVLEVDGTAVATFVKEPRNAAQKGRPWTRISFTSDSEATPCSDSEVAMTALWGWTSVPPVVKGACMLQANRFFTRRNAPFGVAGSPDAGSEMRLLSKLDPDVAIQLRTVRRTRAPG